ncbi:hypothetical protein ACFQH5_20150 [Halomonas salifodinae]|uniref:Lipoprotein n=1 Tax=Halomonas salifodinae TaxID=438745 RepID=A0ABW2F328_9GAMM
MKHIAILLAAALTGCASLPGSEPPHYDYAQQAVIAPGFPVERVDQPAGYDFVDTERLVSNQSYEDGRGVARMRDFGVGWHTTEGGTSVVSVVFREVDSPAYMHPFAPSNGVDLVGPYRVTYLHDAGAYRDVAGEAPGLIPAGAPGCAYGTFVTITSEDAQRRFIGSYSQGIECDRLGALEPLDWNIQRRNAYQVLGLH